MGEEYTDIWQYSAFQRTISVSRPTRAALVLLPTLPGYLLARLDDIYPDYGQPSRFRKTLKTLPSVLEVLAELNLAIFYINGTYYDLVKRLLGIRKVRTLSCRLNSGLFRFRSRPFRKILMYDHRHILCSAF
jgi:peroxin-10